MPQAQNYTYEPTGHKGVRRYRLRRGGYRYYAQSSADGRLKYLGRHSTIADAIAAVKAFDAAHPKHPGRRRKPMPPKAAAELAAMEAAAKERQTAFDTAIDELKRPPGRDVLLCVACGADYAELPKEGRCPHCGGYHFEIVRIPDDPVVNNYPRHSEAAGIADAKRPLLAECEKKQAEKSMAAAVAAGEAEHAKTTRRKRQKKVKDLKS